MAQVSRRYVFIAQHRGGPLSLENHRKLIKWARKCVEHVLFLYHSEINVDLLNALNMSLLWENGTLPTGLAIKASLKAHTAARLIENPVEKAMARAMAQTVATAHMADHAAAAARYCLKAAKMAGVDAQVELNWQLNALADLSPEILRAVEAILNK